MKKRLMALITAVIITLTGSPVLTAYGDSSIPADASLIAEPSGLLLLDDQTLLVTDLYYNVIWKKSGSEETVVAGNVSEPEVSNTSQELSFKTGYQDGKRNNAVFNSPWGIAPYREGYVITDYENNVVRYMQADDVKTLAGSGKQALVNGSYMESAFHHPTGIVAADDGSLYVADTGNHVIRKIDEKGVVSTFAGGSEGCADGSLESARFREPTGLYYKDGVLLVADSGNHRICKIENQSVTTIAGGTANRTDEEVLEGGYRNGSIGKALFSNPQGVALDSDDTIYVADSGNGAIRVIKDQTVETLLDLRDSASYPISPRTIIIKGDQLIVSDVFAQMIFTVNKNMSTNKNFADVSPKAWYAPAVQEVVSQGLFGGVSETSFDPKGNMNRAMFVTVLSRMQSKIYPATIIDGVSQFDDVSEKAYYRAPVAWAADQELVQGSGENFFPQRDISRQELVTILYRYATDADFGFSESIADNTSSGNNSTSEDLKKLTDYADHTEVAGWAAEACNWAVNNGILQGSNGKLHPKDKVTRAEAAQVILNFERMR